MTFQFLYVQILHQNCCLFHSFYFSISLGVIWHGSQFLHFTKLSQLFEKIIFKFSTLAGPATPGGPGGPCPPLLFGNKGKSRKDFKVEAIKRLSPRLKCYCFSHSRAPRIQNFFLSANHGGLQYFPVFLGPYT